MARRSSYARSTIYLLSYNEKAGRNVINIRHVSNEKRQKRMRRMVKHMRACAISKARNKRRIGNIA